METLINLIAIAGIITIVFICWKSFQWLDKQELEKVQQGGDKSILKVATEYYKSKNTKGIEEF